MGSRCSRPRWPWCGPTRRGARRTSTCGALQVGPLDLEHWAADGALTLFFFVAGLELKREFVVGSLRRPADAAVPVVAAACGVAVPALIYLGVNGASDAGRPGGWAIPAATDIAFALAVLAVVGVEPAAGPARVPAHAGGRGRPDRDRGDRGLLHLDPAPRAARGRGRGLRRVGGAAAAAGRHAAGLRAARPARLVVRARERHPRHDRRRRAGAADPGATRRGGGERPRRAARAPAAAGVGGLRSAVLRLPLRRRGGRRWRRRCCSDPSSSAWCVGLVLGKPVGVLGGRLVGHHASPAPS